MMTRRAQDNLVAVLLLGFFMGVIFLCLDFGPRARMIPLPLAVIGIVLTLLQLAWQNFGSTADLQMEMITVSEPDVIAAAEAVKTPLKEDNVTPRGWSREAGAYLMVAAFVALVFSVGIMPAVFVFTAGYFLLSRQYTWRRGLVYTVPFAALLYVLFGLVLGIQPYHGLLAPLFAQ